MKTISIGCAFRISVYICLGSKCNDFYVLMCQVWHDFRINKLIPMNAKEEINESFARIVHTQIPKMYSILSLEFWMINKRHC